MNCDPNNCSSTNSTGHTETEDSFDDDVEAVVDSILTHDELPPLTQVQLKKIAHEIGLAQEQNQGSFPPIIAGHNYRPQAAEMRVFGAVQTLAAWRHKGKGPPYTLCGSNVTYEGSDLLAWLSAQRVDPEKGAA